MVAISKPAPCSAGFVSMLCPLALAVVSLDEQLGAQTQRTGLVG